MFTRRTKLALLVTGVIVLAAVWSSSMMESEPQAPSTTTRSADSAPLVIQWHQGVAQQYRVLTDSSIRTGTATGSGSSMAVSLQGLLDMLVLEAGQHEALVGMKLSSVDMSINGISDTGVDDQLGAPFRVHFVAGGMPAAFDFPAATSTRYRAMLENLVRMFQVSISTSATWVAQESNGNGSYEAVYRRLGSSQIEKSKQGFTAPPDSMLAGASIASTEQLHLDPARDWMVAMKVDETLQAVNRNSPVMTLSNKASLALQADAQSTLTRGMWDFESSPALVDDLASGIEDATADTPVEETRRQILALVPELDSAEQGRISLVHRLADLVRSDDALPAVLLDVLQTHQLSDRTRADLYLVFEQAATDSAQASLVSVFTDVSAWSMQDGMRAIVAMGGVGEPNPDSTAALWNTALNTVPDSDSQRIASAATYALGSIGRSMQDAGNPDYDSLRSSLLGNALDGGDDRQRSDFVIALGNTHDSSLARDIVGLLDDDAASVRRAAAVSLGMLDVDQAADRLVSRYRQEDAGRVRGAITRSLVNWSQPTESAMAVFRDAVINEPDESARYNLAMLLGENLSRFPQNEAVLKGMMRTEPSKRIRQKVADLLSGS